MEESSKIPILGYTKREDVRDVLVLPESGKPWEGRGVIGLLFLQKEDPGREAVPAGRVSEYPGKCPDQA